jgi:hypothetical protein
MVAHIIRHLQWWALCCASAHVGTCTWRSALPEDVVGLLGVVCARRHQSPASVSTGPSAASKLQHGCDAAQQAHPACQQRAAGMWRAASLSGVGMTADSACSIAACLDVMRQSARPSHGMSWACAFMRDESRGVLPAMPCTLTVQRMQCGVRSASLACMRAGCSARHTLVLVCRVTAWLSLRSQGAGCTAVALVTAV